MERLTLARRFTTKQKLDLLWTFGSDTCRHPVSRSFYYSDDNFSFAGQSPELLAEGTRASFQCHKLSGTWRINPSFRLSDQLKAFISSPRIKYEHESSIRTIYRELCSLGSTKKSMLRVMVLPSLLHGWTQFRCQPNENTTIAKCIQSIFPYGMWPINQGMQFIASHEDFDRGPYFGLAGVIRPNGKFSFSQVLRCGFQNHSDSYLMTGAAITRASTPEMEADETMNKVCSISIASL